MTEIREPGKLGKLAPKELDGLHLIEHYLVNPLPKAPATCDNTDGIEDWGMLANDVVGDCGVAGYFHKLMADAARCHETESFPSADQVKAAYFAYTGGEDTGVVLSDFLQYAMTKGVLGWRIAGHAPFNAKSMPELRSVTSLFTSAYVGVQLPAPAMDQFRAGLPWDLTGKAADKQILGGHCITSIAYRRGMWVFVSWGREQLATERWVEHYIDEGHAIVTPEFVAANPSIVDVAMLNADLRKLA